MLLGERRRRPPYRRFRQDAHRGGGPPPPPRRAGGPRGDPLLPRGGGGAPPAVPPVSAGRSQRGVAAAGVVEADQVAGAVPLVRVVVGAHLADAAVAEAEPLGAAV